MGDLEKKIVFKGSLKSAKTNNINLTHRVYNIENSLIGKVNDSSVSDRIEKVVEREFAKISHHLKDKV